jgi:regulator of sirC expression with transglutaminase-like and TPR domain
MKRNVSRGQWRWTAVALLALLCLAFAVAGRQALRRSASAPSTGQVANSAGAAPSAPDRLASNDVAMINLRCAEGLPGAEALDLQGCLAQLNQWAAHVRAETERHRYRYKANPREFENSEGYFRMLMMAVVVAEDFGVSYNPDRIGPVSRANNSCAPSVSSSSQSHEAQTPSERSAVRASSRRLLPFENAATSGDGFFADSQDVFLHGLLGPRRMGTCSSMPILYLALGRRLGYPLKLVATKGHLFLRWESETERFNLEATGRGMNRYHDAHYRQWPFPLTEQEIAENGYLQSLSPEEERAVFLTIRSECLKENGRLAEAEAALSEAVKLAPNVKAYRLLLAKARGTLVEGRPASAHQPTLGAPERFFAPMNRPRPTEAEIALDPNPMLKNR